MAYSASLGQGQAQVLDNPRDPLSLYLSGQQGRALADLRRQQQELQQQKQRDSETAKILNEKYQDPGDRFRVWGQGFINDTNQNIISLLDKNPDINAIRPNIVALQGEAQKGLNLAKEINNVYDEKQALINQIPNVDKTRANEYLGQLIKKDTPYDVDRDQLENMEQHPGIYDINSLVAESVKNVKDQFQKESQEGGIQKSPLGLFTTIKDRKVRFKDLDETMNYMFGGDDTEFGKQARVAGNQIYKTALYGIAQKETAQSGGNPNDYNEVLQRFNKIKDDRRYTDDVREAIRPILKQLDQEEMGVKIQSMGKFRQKTGSEKDKLAARDVRRRDLDALIKPFGSHGQYKDATERSQNALGALRGGDFMGGKIMDASFKKGGYTVSKEYLDKIENAINSGQSAGEMAQLLGDAYKFKVPVQGNADVINFKIKTPDDQINKIIGKEIDGIGFQLNEPRSKRILNALMNQNSGEDKITWGELYNENKSSAPQFLDEDEDEEESGYLDE
jgi:hypothetical protein